MSPLRTLNDLLDRLDKAYVRARRATAVPVILRLLAAVTTAAALLVGLPTSLVFGRLLVYFIPLALLLGVGVGLFPRSRWVSLSLLAGALAWVVAGVAFGDAASLLRIGLLGALLYTAHAAAAYAAVIPIDTVVAPGVLLRWAGRQAAVLGVGLAVGLAGLTVARLIPPTPTLIGPLVGAVVAAALAALLALLARSRE